jgi:hypothetical protein
MSYFVVSWNRQGLDLLEIKALGQMIVSSTEPSNFFSKSEMDSRQCHFGIQILIKML